jgi:hypothetical protein
MPRSALPPNSGRSARQYGSGRCQRVRIRGGRRSSGQCDRPPVELAAALVCDIHEGRPGGCSEAVLHIWRPAFAKWPRGPDQPLRGHAQACGDTRGPREPLGVDRSTEDHAPHYPTGDEQRQREGGLRRASLSTRGPPARVRLVPGAARGASPTGSGSVVRWAIGSSDGRRAVLQDLHRHARTGSSGCAHCHADERAGHSAQMDAASTSPSWTCHPSGPVNQVKRR